MGCPRNEVIDLGEWSSPGREWVVLGESNCPRRGMRVVLEGSGCPGR